MSVSQFSDDLERVNMTTDNQGVAGAPLQVQRGSGIDPKTILIATTSSDAAKLDDNPGIYQAQETPAERDKAYDDAQAWANAGFAIVPLGDPAVNTDAWEAIANKAGYFADHPEHRVGWILPSGFFAIANDTPTDLPVLVDFFMGLSVKPNFMAKNDGLNYVVYRCLEPGLAGAISEGLAEGISLMTAGQAIPLPSYTAHIAKASNAKTVGEIKILLLDDLQPDQPVLDTEKPTPHAIVEGTPLQKHSLQGMADEFEQMGIEAEPLLGDVCISGQSTIWYAAPNSGKTLIGMFLILEAIRESRIHAENVYYINADDNSAGLAAKLRILDDVGAHTLVPGFKGFNAYQLRDMLTEMAQADKARGTVVVIDTAKKFASLMDKKDISGFANVCRLFVMHGGTILAFAHTNKNPGPDGKLRYAGTTDLLEDFDAAFYITPFDMDQPGAEKVVRFENIKARGDRPEAVAYAYSTENGLTYAELLASVERVQFDQLGQIERDLAEQSDTELIEAVKACIGDGINTKMDLANEVAKRTKTSGKGAVKLIDRYTGDDPARHYWHYTIGERGKHIFTLLSLDKPAPD